METQIPNALTNECWRFKIPTKATSQLEEIIRSMLILTVIVCFILMVVFILRLNGENLFLHTRAIHYVNNLTGEKAVKSIQNPFHVTIKTQANNGLSDGVDLNFSLLHSCKVYTVMGRKPNRISSKFGKSMAGYYHKFTGFKMATWSHPGTEILWNSNLSLSRLEKGMNKQIHISTPDCVTEDKLGQSPRDKYPLVVITTDSEDAISTDHFVVKWNHQYEFFSPQVAMFTVIHLKDNICKLDTQIVSQYLKTKDEEIRHLQPLFVTSSSESSHRASNLDGRHRGTKSDTDSVIDDNSVSSHNTATTGSRRNSSDRSDTSDNYEDCIVCQSLSISYALLPCRHACVCHVCLKKIGDRCPMCRGGIEMYFKVKSIDSHRDSTGSSTGSSEDLTGFNSETRWEALNRRINEYFGFM
ncbi:hypothetical protein KUTeg_013284 [Tegillarca granosa]|uniref:RING-type domain-containing protein n=1 Tax=Tegillarca granosa TaxID=220873 RepID=A0ABQ9EX85_TEGGR|nr:hypothetical protein KUTeg_013284 [Tegillarca granosa]